MRQTLVLRSLDQIRGPKMPATRDEVGVATFPMNQNGLATATDFNPFIVSLSSFKVFTLIIQAVALNSPVKMTTASGTLLAKWVIAANNTYVQEIPFIADAGLIFAADEDNGATLTTAQATSITVFRSNVGA